MIIKEAAKKMLESSNITQEEFDAACQIQDEFDKYVAKKVSAYGSRIVKKILVPDKVEAIAKAVGELKDLDVILF